MMAEQENLAGTLEKRLEEQLKTIKNHGDKAATEALKTFDKVYKSQKKSGKKAQSEFALIKYLVA